MEHSYKYICTANLGVSQSQQNCKGSELKQKRIHKALRNDQWKFRAQGMAQNNKLLCGLPGVNGWWRWEQLAGMCGMSDDGVEPSRVNVSNFENILLCLGLCWWVMTSFFFAQSFADGILIREMDCSIGFAYGQDTHAGTQTHTRAQRHRRQQKYRLNMHLSGLYVGTKCPVRFY